MAATEHDLRSALAVTAGTLVLLAERLGLDEGTRLRFTGEHEHLGAFTLGEALDKADAVLGAVNHEPKP